MRYLGPYDVLAIAARVLQCDSEDAVRRTDLDAVERVLDGVRLTSGLAESAGVLLAGLVRRRPFDGANRVVAVAVVLQFLSLNRADLDLEPVSEVDELLDRITSRQATDREVGNFVRSRLHYQPVTSEEVADVLRLDITADIEVEWWRGVDMYERFSDPARRVVVLAQEEARRLQHAYVGTEHLLLGVIEEGDGIAARVLAGLGIQAPAVRGLVVEIIGRGKAEGVGSIPFTPRAKSVFEFAWGECRERGADQVGTEHLLLGILRDGDGVGGQILTRLTADPDDVRNRLEAWINRRQRAETVLDNLVADESANWATFGRRHHLIAELNAVLDENERLHEQVAHLRDLLRKHDIDPDS
ncbi:Clp protease N-terminal domain-containing protein [Kribbella sp. NPDC026611]|uniref:Clp protease N-terminal domain-containing protein n=1 Tax=Kribbella sp. NPDC026611 TaxID=3154911 RepID=UPI0033F62D7F